MAAWDLLAWCWVLKTIKSLSVHWVLGSNWYLGSDNSPKQFCGIVALYKPPAKKRKVFLPFFLTVSTKLYTSGTANAKCPKPLPATTAGAWTDLHGKLGKMFATKQSKSPLADHSNQAILKGLTNEIAMSGRDYKDCSQAIALNHCSPIL